jgi:hypothetical protein
VASWTWSDGTSSVQGAGGRADWSGTAVASGEVSVYLTDGTVLQGTLTVADRGWTWVKDAESTFGDGTGVQCLHWSTPDRGGSNGINLPQGASSCAVVQRMIQPDSYDAGDGFRAVTVQDGPNKGFHYIQTATLWLRRESSINAGLGPDAPQVPLLRVGFGQRPCSSMVNWYQFTLCQGVDPEAYITGIRNHEGYGSTGHNGHYSTAYDAVTNPANDPMIYFDQIVGSNRIDWDTFVMQVRFGFYPRAAAVDRATLDTVNGGTLVTGNYSGIYYGYYAPQGEFFSHYRND